MKKEQIICDSCHKEIKEGHFRRAELSFYIDEWSGGSMGGAEDITEWKADLCKECAHKLKRFLIDELGL